MGLCRKYLQNHYRAEMPGQEGRCTGYGIPAGSVDRPWLPEEFNYIFYKENEATTVRDIIVR